MQFFLDLLIEFFGYKWFVIAFSDLILPAVNAVIKWIAYKLMNSGMTYFVPCSGPETFFIHHLIKFFG